MKLYSQDLLVLTSPPASGKTFWIESFSDFCQEKILVIAPLRALRDECAGKWGEKIIVMTPEEWLQKKTYADIVIFDEFHLHFYWGDTFRPNMWEVFFELSGHSTLTILLTATLSQVMLDEIATFETQFDHMLWVDCGNQKLKYQPQRYFKAPSKHWLSELIFCYLPPGVKLIFCEYREEVYEWEKKLRAKGFRVWTCVGGEAKKMQALVHSEEAPDFIIATTVLSHGVNLPTITCVYFLYPLDNIDFWIQMVARGGRKGEKFEVFALENPHGIMLSKWANTLALLRFSFTMKRVSFFEDIEQCFLKESS